MYARILDIGTTPVGKPGMMELLARDEFGVRKNVTIPTDERTISAFLRGEPVYVTDRPTHKEW